MRRHVVALQLRDYIASVAAREETAQPCDWFVRLRHRPTPIAPEQAKRLRRKKSVARPQAIARPGSRPEERSAFKNATRRSRISS